MPPSPRLTGWSLAAVLLASLSCHKPPSVPLNQVFQLQVGHYVMFSKSDLYLLFRRVAQDSRCPTGAQCIAAGKAVATFEGRILKGPSEPFDVVLSEAGPDEKGRAYDGYNVHLLRLEPHPVAGQAVDTTTYVATLAVEKR
jgi:hypothetical protein